MGVPIRKIMNIETLKAETFQLSRQEKLNFLKFLADVISSEEEVFALTEEQKKTLVSRQNELKSGKVQAIPAEIIKAKLVDKYGLQG